MHQLSFLSNETLYAAISDLIKSSAGATMVTEMSPTPSPDTLKHKIEKTRVNSIGSYTYSASLCC